MSSEHVALYFALLHRQVSPNFLLQVVLSIWYNVWVKFSRMEPRISIRAVAAYGCDGKVAGKLWVSKPEFASPTQAEVCYPVNNSW
jgi:hypothetical protein